MKNENTQPKQSITDSIKDIESFKNDVLTFRQGMKTTLEYIIEYMELHPNVKTNLRSILSDNAKLDKYFS